MPSKISQIRREDKSTSKQLVLIDYNADHMEIKHCPKDLKDGSLKQCTGSGHKAALSQEEQGSSAVIEHGSIPRGGNNVHRVGGVRASCTLESTRRLLWMCPSEKTSVLVCERWH